MCPSAFPSIPTNFLAPASSATLGSLDTARGTMTALSYSIIGSNALDAPYELERFNMFLVKERELSTTPEVTAISRGAVARKVPSPINLVEEDLEDDAVQENEQPATPEQQATPTPEPEPEPEPEPKPKPIRPVVVLMHTTYEKEQITNDAKPFDQIGDFGVYTYMAKQRSLVAEFTASLGYSYRLISSTAYITHLKNRKEPKSVDLKPKGGWPSVEKFIEIYHQSGKSDLVINIEILYARKRPIAGEMSETEGLSPKRPAKKQLVKSQQVGKSTQKGLDAAATIREPGSQNAEFLAILDELKTRWKCSNRQCSNINGTCAIFEERRHSSISLEDARLWVCAIIAKKATIEAAPSKLIAKKLGEKGLKTKLGANRAPVSNYTQALYRAPIQALCQELSWALSPPFPRLRAWAPPFSPWFGWPSGMPPAPPQHQQQWQQQQLQQQQAFEQPGRSGAGPYQSSELAPGCSGASLHQRYAEAPERPGASLLQRLSASSLQHSEHVLRRESSFRPEAFSRMQRRSKRPGNWQNAPGGRRNSAYPLASKPPPSFAPESSSLDDYKELEQFSKRGYSEEPVESDWFTGYQESFKDGDFTNDLLLNPATVDTHEVDEEGGSATQSSQLKSPLRNARFRARAPNSNRAPYLRFRPTRSK
ncbi:MAG: hypothetical protein M1829_006857 [Trizodia sp. TS-e1964]|nr:MAG: hypothetical protein M1829_006857 [Trizodia sp. TS-e1964]